LAKAEKEPAKDDKGQNGRTGNAACRRQSLACSDVLRRSVAADANQRRCSTSFFSNQQFDVRARAFARAYVFRERLKSSGRT
jgi:hypothetical protein